MGYTVLFDPYKGSLYGRYPATLVFPAMLALADKDGCVDYSIEALAGMTGAPSELIREGIEQLTEPDPRSRNAAEDGRRLVPIEGQPFGWRVVTHSAYREKARLLGKSAREVATGANRERMQTRRGTLSPKEQAFQDNATRDALKRARDRASARDESEDDDE